MSFETAPKTTSSRRLGRGLASLIRPAASNLSNDDAKNDSTYVSQPVTGKESIPVPSDGQTIDIRIDQIAGNPYQPRRDFDAAKLEELAQSIRQGGILQPLIVRKSRQNAADKPFVLIAGERRLRAARQAGLEVVPCIVRDATDQQMMEWAVVENIQREDLNPLERARAYQDYMDRFSLTQEDVSQRLSQPRTTVANHLRILDLCDEVQEMIASGQLSFGHAKVLAGFIGNASRQVRLARQIVAKGLSVRKLEELTSRDEPPSPGARQAIAKPAYVRDVEERLTQAVGTRVTVLPGRRKNVGRIVIEYYSLEDFDRIASALGLERSDG
jgi:ParB family chromosome partitioning protein